MRYGIMGGTFSPIHIGHLILAEEVRRMHGLDRILFIPSGRPPHKEESRKCGQTQDGEAGHQGQPSF